jgi:hypothetical protein
MSNQNFSNNPFIQSPQDPNFQFNQSVNNNYNPQNPTPTTASGMQSGGMSPMNQNIPPIPPVPPMNPNFPPMPPMPQNKSSSGLIIAIVVVLVLLLVSGLGIGGFVYWNNLQKQQAIEKLTVSIDKNQEKYNALTEQTIKDLESLSKSYNSVSASNLLESFTKVVNENINTLTQLEQKHQDLIDDLNSENQNSLKDFNESLKKEIENAKEVLTANKILHQTTSCYIDSLNNLEKTFVGLGPIFSKIDKVNSSSNNPSAQDYINLTNQLLDEIEKMEKYNQSIIDCLEKNPNFGSPNLVVSYKNLQKTIMQMKDGLQIFKSGLQKNQASDVQKGAQMFIDAIERFNLDKISQSSLPQMPKEIEKSLNEYKLRVNSGKKTLEEKKNQVLEKVKR